jgi:hypothetical protein
VYPTSTGEFNGTLYVMTESYQPDQLTGYSDYSDSEVADLTSATATLTGFDTLTHDVGIISADLDADGSIEDWGVMLSMDSRRTSSDAPSINMYRSPTSTKGFEAYTRGTAIEAGSPDLATTTASVWGAMWRYEGMLYASENSANGVWQILANMVNASDVSSLVTLRYAGPSSVSTAADGLNCMLAESPWPTCGNAGNGTSGGPVTDVRPPFYHPLTSPIGFVGQRRCWLAIL